MKSMRKNNYKNRACDFLGTLQDNLNSNLGFSFRFSKNPSKVKSTDFSVKLKIAFFSCV